MNEANKRTELLRQARDLVDSAILLLVEPFPSDPSIDSEIRRVVDACDDAMRRLDGLIGASRPQREGDPRSDFIRTGVFMTPEQLSRVKAEFSLPVMMIGGSVPDPWELIDRYAMEQGLPPTETQYGADLQTGEILRVGHRSKRT